MPTQRTLAEEPKSILDNILPEDVVKRGHKLRVIFWVSLLVLILVCLARVPYSGNYVDSYILDFTIGHAKYWIYIFLCTFIILKIFNVKWVKKILSKRFIISYFILILATIFAFAIANSIIVLINGDSSLNFIHEFDTYWQNFSSYAHQQNYDEFINLTISGGVVGWFLLAVWQYVALAIISLFTLVLLIIAICGLLGRQSKFVVKIRHFCVALLGGNIHASQGYDELAVDKKDIKPKVYRSIDIQREANKSNQLTPPITFLTDTSIDNYFENKRKGEKYQTLILQSLRAQNIRVNHGKTTIMPLYTNVAFELANPNDDERILKLKNRILHELKTDKFIITHKGNIVNFEIPNLKLSKISIKSILMTLDKFYENVAVIGLDSDGRPLVLDLKQNPNILIVGQRGSGASMLLSVLIISLAYVNMPDQLEFVILSHAGDKFLRHFNNLQHLRFPLVVEIEDIIKELHIFNAEVMRREKLLHTHKTTSISSLNSKLNNDVDRVKTLVLVITGFDKLIKTNAEIENIVSNILSRSQNLNIKVILSCTNANEQTLIKDINMRFVLKLESEQESNALFGNKRGLELYGNGDGYMFDLKNDKRIRFQSCYLNVSELIQIINTINSFFQFKNEPQ